MYISIHSAVFHSSDISMFTRTLYERHVKIPASRLGSLACSLTEGQCCSKRFHCSNGYNGPLARYVTLRAVHAPGMPGTFSPPLRVSNPDMHHGTCVTHVSWCMPGSLTSGFLWSWWLGKRSRHSRRMRNPRFYVFGKRPMSITRNNLPITPPPPRSHPEVSIPHCIDQVVFLRVFFQSKCLFADWATFGHGGWWPTCQ